MRILPTPLLKGGRFCTRNSWLKMAMMNLFTSIFSGSGRQVVFRWRDWDWDQIPRRHKYLEDHPMTCK